MIVEELRRIVDRITYKPGYRFEVSNLNPWGTIDIILHGRVSDAQNPNRTMELHSIRPIDFHMLDAMDEQQVIEFLILYLIRDLENHEIDEWYKYKGVCVRDPHPELKEMAKTR